MNLAPPWRSTAWSASFQAATLNAAAQSSPRRRYQPRRRSRRADVWPRRLSSRAHPGFLNFAGQDTVFCILIIPPPLLHRCRRYTAFATEVGGGARIRLDTNDRLHVNVDVGNLLVRYSPDEPFRRDDEFGDISDSLFTNNLIFNAGTARRASDVL